MAEEAESQHTPSLFADEPICDRPGYIKGQAISNVPTEDFNCDHQYYYYYYDNDNDSDGEQTHVETGADNDTDSANHSDNGRDSKSVYDDYNYKVQSSNDDDDIGEEDDNEDDEFA